MPVETVNSVKQSYPFGRLGYEVRRSIDKDLDSKIIITSHNSKPGLGKTTLAILMARQWDPHGWSAEEKAFMDVYEYRDAYMNQPSGSVFVFDEIEGEADSRRAVSNKNVELSQAWAQLRYKNKVTIATLPTTSMLDNRMLEMADYWINVMSRGVAHPYKIYVNDFTGKVYRDRMDDGSAVIQYPDLAGDPDYEHLKAMKDESNRTTRNYISEEEHEKELKSARKEASRETRNKLIRDLYKDPRFNSREIGELAAVDLSRQRVDQICSDISPVH